MWIFTNFGFFSIVRKPDDIASATVTVRARTRADLESLRDKYLPKLGPIQKHAGSDYRYRAKTTQGEFAAALEKIALDIDYDNFKTSVAKKQGANRSHLYEKVWSAMYELQDSEPISKPGKPEVVSNPPAAKPHATKKNSGVRLSFGGVLFTDRGSILLRKPRNEFDNYVWTFAKGYPQSNESPEVTALREVGEETGFRAEIVGEVPGPPGGYVGGIGSTIYYLMKALPDPKPFGHETEQIIWVSPEEAPRYIEQTRNEVGRKRDLLVLEAAIREYHRLGR